MHDNESDALMHRFPVPKAMHRIGGYSPNALI